MAIGDRTKSLQLCVHPNISYIGGDKTLLSVAERLLLSPLTILLSHSPFLSFFQQPPLFSYRVNKS